VRLTSRQCEPDRQAIGIDHRMNLAGQPASTKGCVLLSIELNKSTTKLASCVIQDLANRQIVVVGKFGNNRAGC